MLVHGVPKGRQFLTSTGRSSCDLTPKLENLEIKAREAGLVVSSYS